MADHNRKLKTPGLSHLSYLIGSGGKAAVIDPRRDCAIYVEKTRAQGLEIKHVFETHRNVSVVRTFGTSLSLTHPQRSPINQISEFTHEPVDTAVNFGPLVPFEHRSIADYRE